MNIQPDSRSKSYAIAAVIGCDYRLVLDWIRTGELPRGPIAERLLIASKELGIVPNLVGKDGAA